jgi:endonuclease YncB( thermonuclease family)
LFSIFLGVLMALAQPAAAAEVLQVPSPTLVIVGDRNRSYAVELACVAIPPGQHQEALDWLRQALPRHSAVNLRPTASQDGQLQAHLSTLTTKAEPGRDVGAAMVAAGLATALPCS